MIRVWWVQEAGELSEWGFPLARSLRDHGIEAEFFLKLRNTVRQAEKAGLPAQLLSPSCYQGPSVSSQELERLEKTYGTPGLWAIVQSNAQFDWLGLPMDDRLQIVARYMKYWERAVDERVPDYVFFKTLGTAETRTLYNVARHRGIPYFQFSIGPVAGTFTMNDVGEALNWHELQDAVRSGPRPLTAAEEEHVLNHLPDSSDANLDSNRGKPNVRWAPKHVSGLAKHIARAATQSVRGASKLKRWSDDPVQVAVDRQILRLQREQLLWMYVTSRRFRYAEPARGERFVYLPLFHYYEGTTLATCLYWATNALSLIEHCASMLPVGHMLYVKEHPIHLGQRSLAELERLRTHPRIRVIDPRVPGNRLTASSEAVVVVEGTSGWEALLHRKPLVALGTRFYTACPTVHRVDNIGDLEEALHEAVAEGDEVYDRRREEWLWFLHCAMTTCGQGTLYPVEYPYIVPTDPENLERLASSVEEKVRRTLARQGWSGDSHGS